MEPMEIPKESPLWPLSQRQRNYVARCLLYRAIKHLEWSQRGVRDGGVYGATALLHLHYNRSLAFTPRLSKMDEVDAIRAYSEWRVYLQPHYRSIIHELENP